MAATANGHMRPQGGGQATRRAIGHADADAAVAQTSLAAMIGETVAAHLAPLLGELVHRVTAQPECFFCLTKVVALVREYQTAIANAQQAGEPVPAQPPAPPVNRSVTRVPVIQMAQGAAGPVPVACDVPACFECMRAQTQATPRQVGLVAADGRPIVART